MINLASLMEESSQSSGQLTQADIEAVMQRMFDHESESPLYTLDSPFYIRTKTMNHFRHLYAIGKRYARRQGIRRRQRRAAQRKHQRGML